LLEIANTPPQGAVNALLGWFYTAIGKMYTEIVNEPFSGNSNRRNTMSKFKFAVLVALVLAFGLMAISNAMAGQRIKYRAKHCNVSVKYDPAEVGDEPGHVISTWQAKGIGIILEGTSGGPYKLDLWGAAESRADGYATDCGYGKITYPDGSSYMIKWKDTEPRGGRGTGTAVYYGGTGRFKGMKGGEEYNCLSLGDRFMCDIDAWMELP
jgi:hypothetical protein